MNSNANEVCDVATCQLNACRTAADARAMLNVVVADIMIALKNLKPIPQANLH